MDILTVIERVVAERPMTVAGIERLAGCRLREDPGNSNPYIRLYRAGGARSPIRTVELRLPKAGATRKDGLLILELDDRAAGLRQADLVARFGPDFTLDVPTPDYPPDYPAYTIYSYPWGDLRLGLRRASGLLETVVIDAER
ncbi:MAG TPA: hypothetical protein VF017_01590 [Thermoanaerobaculia bacterium]|nr:hypothetical protein [Thermoanaerobaculia bacterium]